jgi:IS5 family transposase
MRKLITYQEELDKTPRLGYTPIEEVQLDLSCRDEITKTLRGIQALYSHKETREELFRILKTMIIVDSSKNSGRKGMDLWTIFVLATLRLSCNWDYDKLRSCFNNHRSIREMSGVDMFCDFDKLTGRQTIHDNVSLFTKEIANQVSKLSIDFGHRQLFPKCTELKTRCDSFVFLSNVHFPTDYNLLLDSVRKVLSICVATAKKQKLSGWREHQSLWNKVRNCYNKLSKMRNSNSPKQKVKDRRTQEILQQVSLYLDTASKYLQKAQEFQKSLPDEIPELNTFLEYGSLFMDQISRRVLNDEKIPPEEKVFSIFEPYTEWICKGKAGVRQELGVKLCIVQDQHGFILQHQIMNHKQDKDVAVDLAQKSLRDFPKVSSMSFDKGFHSKRDIDGNNNRTLIEAMGIKAHLPVKGKRNKADALRESSEDFGIARKQHPAVESAVNALESHGLDRCPDRGEERYNRYAAVAVAASNIHNIGTILMKREINRKKRVS